MNIIPSCLLKQQQMGNLQVETSKDYVSNIQQQLKIEREYVFSDLMRKGKHPTELSNRKQLSQKESAENEPYYSDQDYSKYPQSCIGYFQVNHQNNAFVSGSGFLIYRQLVLTCAQNLIIKQIDTEYKGIKFCLKNNENGIERFGVKKIYYFEHYFEDQINNKQDFRNIAVVELEECVDNRYGYVSIGFNFEIKTNADIFIIGYEVDSQKRIQLSEKKGKYYDHNSKILRHDCHTSQKMRGSPVFYNHQGQIYVVGMDLWSNNTQKQSYSIKLYQNLYDRLNQKFFINVGSLNLKGKGLSNKQFLSFNQFQKQKINHLELSMNNLSPQSIKYIIQLPNIVTLVLNSNIIQDDGVRVLSQVLWPNLREISLVHNFITSAGVEHLVKSSWKELSVFNIQENAIKDTGVEFITKCPWINMKHINLAQTGLTEVGTEYLFKANWRNLESINLECNSIRKMGLKNLIKAFWPELTAINLRKTELCDKSIIFFQNCIWIKMRSLDISKSAQNRISDMGAATLFKMNFPRIKDLSLRENKLKKSLIMLTISNWIELQTLDLRWNIIDEKQHEHIEKVLKKSMKRLKKIYW